MHADEAATRPPPGAPESTARLTYVGHATVLLDLPGARLLTDPVLRGRVGPLLVAHGGVDAAGLPAVDAVLVSHAHRDHFDAPSLARLDSRIRLVGPAAVAHAAVARGVRLAVEVVAAGDELEVAGHAVRVVHAEHGRPGTAVGFLVDGVYFAGDTGLFTGMAELAGAVRVALLPVAGWTPSLGPGHLDPETAVAALRLLRPRVAVPIHWGTVHPPGLGRHRYLRDPPAEFARLAATGAPGVDVRVVPVGGSIEVPA